jgi:hypothetical protein
MGKASRVSRSGFYAAAKTLAGIIRQRMGAAASGSYKKDAEMGVSEMSESGLRKRANRFAAACATNV